MYWTPMGTYICSKPLRFDSMLNKAPNNVFIILLVVLLPAALLAQDESPFSCFNAQEILFPLEQNDFTKNQILVSDNAINALYYVYQDKYTFWYKFIATEDIELQYSVSPTNDQDRYRSVVYQYGAPDFCEQLVNFNLKPVQVKRDPMFGANNKLLYLNTISASAGDTFYISVLSLNDDDCGHYLRMEARTRQLSIHAVHRPCYDFVYLDMPEFSTARERIEDVTLSLEIFQETERKKRNDQKVSEPIVDPIVEEQESTEPDTPKAAPKPFNSLQTIEIQSAEEGIVSVGDKLVLNKVFFYNNTYAFKPEASEELDQLVGFLKDNPSVEIEVHGHTANDTEDIRPDPNFKKQGPEWNFKGTAFKLSEMRAEAVKTYLVSKGIHKKRLKAIGFGDTEKRVPDATTFEDFEKNMRVEALVVKQ